MGNLLCMRLIHSFRSTPTPRGLDRANHRLAARMDVDVLDRDLLLAFAAMTVEGLNQRSMRPRQFVRLIEVLLPPLERLLAQHGASIALHCGVVFAGSDGS